VPPVTTQPTTTQPSTVRPDLADGHCSLQGVDRLPAPNGTAIRLQVYSGAVGGNTASINADRQLGYLSAISDNQLDLDIKVDISSPRVGFVTPFQIPAGKRFVIHKVSYRGCVGYDSNGWGLFKFAVKGHVFKDVSDHIESGARLVEAKTEDAAIELVAGEEHLIELDVSNSSIGEAIVEGAITD
jgi:hypothetical protein